MKINKKTLRKLIRRVIFEQHQIGMEKRLRTSYNKELTTMEEIKFLLGVYTNMIRFAEDIEAVFKVVSAIGKDQGKKGAPNKGKLNEIEKDLKTCISIFETEEKFTDVISLLIQIINTNNLDLLEKLEMQIDAKFNNSVYEVIDIVNYLFNLGTLTGYELSIKEYIALGEKAAKEGYTSSTYPDNESSRFEKDTDFNY